MKNSTTEYQMQMLVNGEWKQERVPTGQPYRKHYNPTEL